MSTGGEVTSSRRICPMQHLKENHRLNAFSDENRVQFLLHVANDQRNVLKAIKTENIVSKWEIVYTQEITALEING